MIVGKFANTTKVELLVHYCIVKQDFFYKSCTFIPKLGQPLLEQRLAFSAQRERQRMQMFASAGFQKWGEAEKADFFCTEVNLEASRWKFLQILIVLVWNWFYSNCSILCKGSFEDMQQEL